MTDPLDRAFAAIDDVNALDPVLVAVPGADGGSRPRAVVHAEHVIRWVIHLDPQAGAAQRLAARAHHLRRWELPRDSHPDGRAGYLRWRTEQKRRHARAVTELLEPLGIDGETTGRVASIVAKVGLGSDPDVQTHEDALCLTFLELQLDELAERVGADRAIEVLVRTMGKMSSAALEIAGSLELPGHVAPLVAAAIERFADEQG